MNLKGNKFVRFEDWKSEKYFSSPRNYSGDYGFYAGRIRPMLAGAWEGIRTGLDNLTRLKIPISNILTSSNNKGANNPSTETKVTKKKRILDPQDSFLQKWNKIFMVVCVLAVAIDPLFFYVPWVRRDENSQDRCLDLDNTMKSVACALRTMIDAVYILRIIFQFRTGFIAPSSRVFGRGELVEDPALISKRYLTSYFFIDVLALLPLPQAVFLIIAPAVKGPLPLAAKNWLEIVIFSQYVPRFARVYPLYLEIARTSGLFTETAHAGAVFNLFLYMLASHIIGAFWYLFSIEREDTCWRQACKIAGKACSSNDFYCGDHRVTHINMKGFCSFIQPDQIGNSTVFNFGIFTDALDSGVVESKNFLQKLFYCFWWGLRNLSSLGQNLKTSTYVGEILFAIFIAILGLVLFSLLIGNMQKFLQSTTVRVEEMRVKRQDAEQWMSHRMLPDNLKERIRRYEQYKWQETRGVEERALIRNLPKDLKRDINRHLCLDLLKKVPIFEKMDEQTLDAVCDRLRPTLYTKDSYIVREGDPVDEMLFIMRGKLVSVTTNGGRTGFFNAANLMAGDFCGEGLLTWALDPQSSSNLPISTRTVQALTEVEAFALVAEDLKSVASQFRQLHHKHIQHTFRYYSAQWKTWAACFVQAAWRRYSKRKQAAMLREAEEKLQDALANEGGTAPSLGVAIYASKFAANALRNLRQNSGLATKTPQRLALLPQKPAEPDFSADRLFVLVNL